MTTETPPRVLILGADGFIGRHIAFSLRREGWDVIASARRTARLKQMGFSTLKADLNSPACHVAQFWQPHLADVDYVINAAGLLRATDKQFENVHIKAPEALYQAMGPKARGLLLSAVGIDDAQTYFAHFRRKGSKLRRTTPSSSCAPEWFWRKRPMVAVLWPDHWPHSRFVCPVSDLVSSRSTRSTRMI